MWFILTSVFVFAKTLTNIKLKIDDAAYIVIVLMALLQSVFAKKYFFVSVFHREQ